MLTATIIKINFETVIITARTAKSMSNKLRDFNIVISEFDIIMLQLTNGYTQFPTPSTSRRLGNSVRINISSK